MDDKKNIVTLPDQDAIDRAAAEWLLTLEEDEVSAEDRAGFSAWCGSNPKHREAFERVSTVWGEFDKAKVLADYAVSDDNTMLVARDVRSNTRWGHLRRRSVLSALAASVAIAVALPITLQFSSRSDEPQSGAVRTAIGEQRKLALPDGSMLELNTDSGIEYEITTTRRDIRLTRGEVYFDVAHDKHKPFRVLTDNGAVTALGTAFSVRLIDEKMNVLVSEGRVALSFASDTGQAAVPAPADNVADDAIELVVGQSAVVEGNTQQIEDVDPERLVERLSWRQGVLAFSSSPLSDVVSDIARYTDIVIVLEDESLRDLPVTGYFGIGEVEEMLEALELMAGLKAERRQDKLIYLTRLEAM